MEPVKLNLKIYQGITFDEILRWETDEKVYKQITGVTNTAPVVVTSANHALPQGWRVRVYGVKGMTQLNLPTGEYYVASEVSQNTISLKNTNGFEYSTYTSSGFIEYNKPKNLSGCTAKMQIRSTDKSELYIELSTSNNRITLDPNGSIRLNISANDTAALNFNSAVYSLEIQDTSGVVSLFVTGSISLIKEITK